MKRRWILMATSMVSMALFGSSFLIVIYVQLIGAINLLAFDQLAAVGWVVIIGNAFFFRMAWKRFRKAQNTKDEPQC